MINLTETNFQRWRAVALGDKHQHLIFVGSSSGLVRKSYPIAYHSLLQEDEKLNIKKIVLQQWLGTANEGRWLTKILLPIPPMPEEEKTPLTLLVK
jgi:hypothetical protein